LLLDFPGTHFDCPHKHSPLPNTVVEPSGSAIFAFAFPIDSIDLSLLSVFSLIFTALTIPAFNRTL